MLTLCFESIIIRKGNKMEYIIVTESVLQCVTGAGTRQAGRQARQALSLFHEAPCHADQTFAWRLMIYPESTPPRQHATHADPSTTTPLLVPHWHYPFHSPLLCVCVCVLSLYLKILYNSCFNAVEKYTY